MAHDRLPSGHLSGERRWLDRLASGDGTGPYKIETGDFGVRFSLTRHDGWHLDGAHFDGVELIILTDPNARQTALVTGDVDAVSLIVEDRWVCLRAIQPGDRQCAVCLDAHHADVLRPTPPFDNKDVRNALKLAMNRDEIIEKIAFGAATKANDFHHSPAMPYWPDDIPQHDYDPDQAKSLLKRPVPRDYPSAFPLQIHLLRRVDLCVLYAEHAKAAGIDIKVVREPNDGYYSDVWLKKPFCVVAWGARPTPDVMYSLAYKSDAAWNESHWQNERFNELLLMAKAELDDTRRAEMYREMALLAHDDGGTIIPFFRNFVYARRSNVQHGEQLASSWELDGARACSRWWFDS